jgi:uncharacterized peroxidase-related enzyme
MSRISQLTAETADAEQRELLEATHQQLGRVPNLYAALANGPAALRGYLALRDALAHGALRLRVREQLALLVANDNHCAYCVAAHTFRGGKIGMSDEQLAATRRAEDDDPHTAAVLRVAREAMRTRGDVPDALLAEARAAGVSDAELAEVVAHVALNTLSNLFNHLARPELDFPAVAP